MISIKPYLNFPGDTEAAFKFYRSVFGGDFKALQRFADLPGGDRIAEADQQKIMHVSLPVGDTVLMATDSLASMGQALTAGNNFTLAVFTESEKDADRIFTALAQGGEISMAMNKAFWGAYVGMLTDKFSIQWMISYDPGK
ncbi:VOC family protein [Paraflavitalea sp. CAU 1676]|uniref:VOC family protein n=1 Tax=Paraflavitalea sp. CAU 1676 TaxID=3032598 RepID=UPI0023DC3B47|nr:VOC family protein [Paraflavitalea sp. CAU 1676]MDF2188614.1 VOC family protein [Paraflavitalea sp. CAU 1676]